MSRAQAPGKLVLSGAYAVLSGAPALVTAVDRYVLADSARAASFRTPEVGAALGEREHPHFDASALRDGEQKLGLGSSAAIVVASLAALELDSRPELGDEALCGAVYGRALVAHRSAQGGGSGVDVAASAHGGTIAARRTAHGLEVSRVTLPRELCFEVWACQVAASTSEFLARVRALQARDAATHDRLIAAQAEAAELALDATSRGDAPAWITAIDRQSHALSALGDAAGIPILTPELRELSALARARGAAFLPAGAGGGDVGYYAGSAAPDPEFAARAEALGLRRVALSFGARGVHALL